VFIVVEGPDQVGKNEQVRLLVEFLRGLGRQVDEYLFPSQGTPTGRVVREWLRDRDGSCSIGSDAQVSRDLAVTFQCVQLVDKYAAVPAILDKLGDGRDVVCCRWWQSSYAYGLDEGLPLDWVTDTCSLLPRADLNVLVDLPPAAAAARSAGSGSRLDRYDRDLAKQERIRQTYLVLWSSREHAGLRSGGRWVLVDGHGTPGEVHERIKTQVPYVQEAR
jgi:thymidylate kinase